MARRPTFRAGGCRMTAKSGCAALALALWACGSGGSGSAAISTDKPPDAPVAPAPPPVAAAHTVTVSLASADGRVTSSPAGIDCPDTCAASFPDGTLVRLTATLSDGFQPAGWGGACAGQGECEVTVSADASVSASFAAVPLPAICDGLVPDPLPHSTR